MQKEIEVKFFKDVFNEILKESGLKINDKSKVKIKEFKLIGKPKEIIKQFFYVFNSLAEKGEIIKSIKVKKIKRIWDNSELSVSFLALTEKTNEKVKLNFLDSEKSRKYKVIFNINNY